MISYVTFGADDIARAKQFYDAFLPALGYTVKEGPDGLGYTLAEPPQQRIALPAFYVKPTFDGRPASSGNGTMIAFEARINSRCVTFTPQHLPLAALTRVNPGFARHMGLGFMWATCAIRKATRSRCFPKTQMSLNATDDPGCTRPRSGDWQKYSKPAAYSNRHERQADLIVTRYFSNANPDGTVSGTPSRFGLSSSALKNAISASI